MDHEAVLSASTRRFQLCIKLSNREFCNQCPRSGLLQNPSGGWERRLRRNSWLRRRLRAEDALEAFAVLKENQYPQYRGHQSRRNACWRKRQVKRKDVVELRRQHCQRQWLAVAREQQQ